MSRFEICFEVGDVILRGDFLPSGRDRTVILVHGGGQTRDCWGGVATGLQRFGWDVVAMDLRGHGGSGWSRDSDYSIHKFSDDLVEVARNFNKPHVIGAYLGGLVAFTALLDGHGILFSEVVMIDAIPVYAPSTVRMLMGRMGYGADSLAICSDLTPDGGSILGEIRKKFPRERKNFQPGMDKRPEWRWDPVLIAALEKGRTRYTRRQFDSRLSNIFNRLSIIVGAYSSIPQALLREFSQYNLDRVEIINISRKMLHGESVDYAVLLELAKILER